jgi:hypothetical protein
MRVLSLGAGIQSTVLLLKSLEGGSLPSLDHVFFADTGWESRATYDHLEQLKSVCSAAGLPFHVVSTGNLKEDTISRQVDCNGERWSTLPVYVKNGDGSVGRLKRHCTVDYKITPVIRKLREILGYAPGERVVLDEPVEQWIGISADEAHRMRFSRHHWIRLVYPLVDYRITRTACIKWLEGRGWLGVEKSSCVGCPFRSNSSWRGLKLNDPLGWADAVEFDRRIRRCKDLEGDAFLHRSGVPLGEVDLRNDVDRGQGLLFGPSDCSGPCGT